tara:strand:- start:4377 stop:5456 length:1080 start_codon:yes stop_codon:yes gene_type:complete
MAFKYKIVHSKLLYIFLTYISLFLFFFSTTKVEGKAFEINNIEITMPFEMEFNKNKVIDDGFREAFSQLMSLIVNSTDKKKTSKIRLNEIKGMIESFSIKEEKFVNETYYVNLGVSFNKKKIFNYLEKNNIFPSTPVKKKILLIPIIIDEKKKDLLVFSNNKFFDTWLNVKENFHLIEYILPTEDLEDLKLLKDRYDVIEQYNFKEIIDKYDLRDSIIVLIFKREEEVRILSRISIMGNVILKNQTFSKTNFTNLSEVENIIKDLQIVYEDFWRRLNQVNTSIKLPLYIKLKSTENRKISKFEKILNETDLIYEFFISKYDNNYIYYQVIFNGTPSIFLKGMSDKGFDFNTENKTWILK